MQFPKGHGQAVCLFGDKVVTLDYGFGRGSWAQGVARNGNVIDDDLEYDCRFDCYYHQSDDGGRMYTSLAVLSLDPTAPPPRVLTQIEVDAYKMIPIQSVLASVMAQQTDPVDLTFATHVFSSPAWLHAFWVQNGHDLPKACQEILTQIFLQ